MCSAMSTGMKSWSPVITSVGIANERSLGGGLENYPNLPAYIARGEARPAYKRAFADQLAVFTATQYERLKASYSRRIFSIVLPLASSSISLSR